MLLLSTRQRASAFNQPLSFDTSSVTNMDYMFHVRSARALPPSLESGSPRACRLRPPSALPPPGPYRAPHRKCPPSDSAARVDVQPAAELRHVQRHEHGRHVSGALRTRPTPPSPPPARCAYAAISPRPLSRLAPCPASYALLSTRQWAYAFNQPLSFDTSSVTNMADMLAVCRRALVPSHQLIGPSPCMPLVPPLPHALPSPRLGTSRLASYARLSSRQGTYVFNQPLSFDTSKVTTMWHMFVVRTSCACPAPNI